MFYTTPVLVFPSNTVISQYKTYYEKNGYVTNIFINLSLGHISNRKSRWNKDPAIKKAVSCQAASTRPGQPAITEQEANPGCSGRQTTQRKIYLSKESM